MVINYRWMQEKDLSKINNDKMKFYLQKPNIIANVLEVEEDSQQQSLLGIIVYRITRKKAKIIKLSFVDNDAAEFMLSRILAQSSSSKRFVEVLVSEYDLRLQCILRRMDFFAKEIKKFGQTDFYKFIGKL